MRKFTVAAAALILTVPVASYVAYASESLPEGLTTGMQLGTTEDAVKMKLSELGFDVRKSEMEDGLLEVYVVRNKEMAEVYVDPKTGELVKAGDD